MEEAQVMLYCDGCDDELVIGDTFYRVGLRRICRQCLFEYALEHFSASLEVVR